MKADKHVVALLIEAMVEYGLASSWCDSDIINTLIECGVTREDFEKFGYSEFVEGYFEE